MESFWGQFFATQVSLLPLYLVWIAGAVYAFMNLKRHPRPALLALIGFGAFLITAFLGIVYSVASYEFQLAYGVWLVWFCLHTLLTVVAWALVFAAALVPRAAAGLQPPRSAPPR
jgi:hypothetical protein